MRYFTCPCSRPTHGKLTGCSGAAVAGGGVCSYCETRCQASRLRVAGLVVEIEGGAVQVSETLFELEQGHERYGLPHGNKGGPWLAPEKVPPASPRKPRRSKATKG